MSDAAIMHIIYFLAGLLVGRVGLPIIEAAFRFMDRRRRNDDEERP